MQYFTWYSSILYFTVLVAGRYSGTDSVEEPIPAVSRNPNACRRQGTQLHCAPHAVPRTSTCCKAHSEERVKAAPIRESTLQYLVSSTHVLLEFIQDDVDRHHESRLMTASFHTLDWWDSRPSNQLCVNMCFGFVLRRAQIFHRRYEFGLVVLTPQAAVVLALSWFFGTWVYIVNKNHEHSRHGQTIRTRIRARALEILPVASFDATQRRERRSAWRLFISSSSCVIILAAPSDRSCFLRSLSHCRIRGCPVSIGRCDCEHDRILVETPRILVDLRV